MLEGAARIVAGTVAAERGGDEDRDHNLMGEEVSGCYYMIDCCIPNVFEDSTAVICSLVVVTRSRLLMVYGHLLGRAVVEEVGFDVVGWVEAEIFAGAAGFPDLVD